MTAQPILQPHPTLLAYYPRESAKPEFLRGIFDAGAADYDRVEHLLSFGKGKRYRREALGRAGLTIGMNVLDVAAGTGLVAREAIAITGSAENIVALDPSAGMLYHAVQALGVRGVLGVAENIPFEPARFDFVSMGYALRHVRDIRAAFTEFFRVLRPGGTACLLEITSPRGRIRRAILRAHMRCLVPLLTRVSAGKMPSHALWQYYWETIENCLSPDVILAALTDAGFVDVRRHVAMGVFSEYCATRPAAMRQA